MSCGKEVSCADRLRADENTHEYKLFIVSKNRTILDIIRNITYFLKLDLYLCLCFIYLEN